MRIINGMDEPVSYELKGGPLRMTLSTCMLLAGEEEVWTSPYRRHQVDVDCEVHVLVDDVPHVVQAADDAVVRIGRDATGAVAITVTPPG